jgi:catechol 2,3-dioxygenase-like lactoylglutathione lyase family enzyme
MKITAVLIVDEIEKCLPFWVERLGFTKTVEVPEGDRLGFVILVHGKGELMLQTVESVRKDTPQFVPETHSGGAALFIEVEDFADVVKRLSGYPIALPDRTTFYGMREIGVFEPCGNPVIFAVPAPTSNTP